MDSQARGPLRAVGHHDDLSPGGVVRWFDIIPDEPPRTREREHPPKASTAPNHVEAPDVESVVDAELRVSGVRDLRIADSTIMPRIVAVPTMPACMLIGLRMAELLVGARRRD